jgi:hypothetical protein
MSLSESERALLARLDKESVLRKVKDQQRYSGCSCTACWRRHAAVEKELERLYDLYCQELEFSAEFRRRVALLVPVPIPV